MESALIHSEQLAGRFIVLDGPDGSGKGTQIERLTRVLADLGLEVVYAQDPGGTRIGNQIREILLHRNLLSEMAVECETFLFMASRAQLVAEVIRPAQASGKVVLCDRFISATCAYQGAAGYDVKRIIDLGQFAVGQTWPDLTLIIDVPVEEAAVRTGYREQDAMESRPDAFHRKVRQGFLDLPGMYPGRVEIIDGVGSPDEVHRRIVEALNKLRF